MKHNVGKLGESIAKEYLRSKGYKILETNWRYRGGEIDIIAISPEGILSFIEVKTRRTEDFGLPEESIDYRKAKKILSGAQLFLHDKGFSESQIEISFDVISITISPDGNFNINHIKNAFSESDV